MMECYEMVCATTRVLHHGEVDNHINLVGANPVAIVSMMAHPDDNTDLHGTASAPAGPRSSGDGMAQPAPHFQLRRRRATQRWIPADLVQNTAEYVERVLDLLLFRSVSTIWQAAVSDAVGFVNGCRWTRLLTSGPLWKALRLDNATVVARCAMLCLARRLETLECQYVAGQLDCTLRPFGDDNTVLTTLSVWERGTSKRTTNLSCLRNFRALKKLSLSATGVTDAGIRGLELIPVLEELNLSYCTQTTDVSCLRHCRALKILNISCSGVTVEGIRGLELIPTLEVLDLRGCKQLHDQGTLRNCSRLRIDGLLDTR
jgi:hypothetical protein